MATFQRFKFLATQCAKAANSPSRSPLPTARTKSPSFNLRRRRTTLRRLLGRSSSPSSSIRRLLRRGEAAEEENQAPPDGGERRRLLRHKSLKELFGSATPSPPNPVALRRSGGYCDGYQSAGAARSAGIGGGRFRSAAALRLRLLSRAWRPALLTIPE